MIKEKTLIPDFYIFITLLLTSIIASIGAYEDRNIAVLALVITFICMGMFFTAIINKVENIKNSLYIFLIFFLIYLAYTFTIHFGLISIYNTVFPFIESDEGFFYQASLDVPHLFKLGYDFFDVTEVDGYADTAGALYFFGLISILADFFQENSILAQKTSVVLVSALIPMLIYSISKLYFSDRIAIFSAFIYGFFSFVPYLSSILLRDIHIALMFIICIYIVLERLSILNLLILFCVSFASYYLREQTGVFMLGFISIYIFSLINYSVQNSNIKIFIYLVFTVLVILLVLSSNELMHMFTTILESSAENSGNQTASGSMGAKMAKLPFGLNIIALLGFGQIQPFPPSLIFLSKKGMFHFTYLMAGIAWFFGWGFLLYGLLKKNILKDIDLKLNLMFALSILYLILVSIIEFNQRRQVPVYPVLYVIMIFSYLKMSADERIKVWVGMFLLYITLTLTINYMKVLV